MKWTFNELTETRNRSNPVSATEANRVGLENPCSMPDLNRAFIHSGKIPTLNRNNNLLGNVLSQISLFGAFAISLGMNTVLAAKDITPFLQSDQGLFAIEAEHYHAKVAKNKHRWKLKKQGNYSGEGAMMATPEDKVSINSKYNKKSPRMNYQVKFTIPGTYYVWLRVLAPTSSSNSVHVGLNGKPLKVGKNITVPVTGDYVWSRGKKTTIKINKPALYTLNLWMRESGTIIDKIVLSSDSGYKPTGQGPKEHLANETGGGETGGGETGGGETGGGETGGGETGGGDTSPQAKDRYLSTIVRFADIALEYGRDNYGPKRTPLFVDNLNVINYKPYRWQNRKSHPQQAKYPAEQIFANFAINQQLQITLRELTKLTGDAEYRNAARDAATYAMENLVDSGGLFYWGHHETYDALNDKVTGLGSPPIHEMKTMIPDFRYLYSLNPSAVKKNIEQYMNVGIKDWEKLSFTRHLVHNRAYKNPLGNTSRINTNQQVPFKTTSNMKRFHYGLPFIDSGISYYHLTSDERAYKLAYQILKRHMDMCNPKTGLGPSAYAYNGSKNTYVTSTKMERYRWAPPILLKKAELLGVDSNKGRALLNWGVAELNAIKKYDFRVKVPPTMLWSYALAYRLTGNPQMWDKAREVMKDYGLGDIGKPSGEGLSPSFGTFKLQPIEGYKKDIRNRNRANNMNGFVIHALVELYEATRQKAFLKLAENVADTILDNLYDNGLFVRQKDGLYARLGDMTPLAFLHLVSANRGVELEVDSVFPRDLYTRVRHAGKIGDKVWDNEVVYCQNKFTKKCK